LCHLYRGKPGCFQVINIYLFCQYVIFSGRKLIYVDSYSHGIDLLSEIRAYKVARTAEACSFVEEIESFPIKGGDQFF